jgi:hypothetical protein
MNMNDGDAHGGASSDDSRGKMTDAEKKVLMVRQPMQHAIDPRVLCSQSW